MANELKKLIREAFNTAYHNYKFKILSESVDTLKSKMSSSDINKAERAFFEIKNNPEIAYKYAWSPQTLNGGNPKDPQAPFNLLMEMLAEKLDPETKKRVFMAIYSDKNPALVNAIKARLMGMKGSHVTSEEATQAIETAWNEMFLGEKYKSGDQLKKSFEDATAEYKPLDSSNFGAYLMRRLVNASSTALRDYYATEKPTSLDAPSPVTGKSSDFGSEEDFGSDTLNPIMNPSADLAGLGAGLEGSEDTGDIEGADEYVSVAGDEETGDEENVSADETIGGGLESDSEEASAAKRNARQMIKRLEKSLYQAIEEYRNYYEPTPNQEKGFLALEEILSGLSPKEATAKLGFNTTAAIQDLKKNKTFSGMVDDYLLRNGFVNSRGKVESFVNMFPQWIADAVKFKLTGEVPKEFPEDRRTSFTSDEPESETTGLDMKQMHKLVIDTKKAVKALKQSGSDSKAIPALEALLTGTDPETVAKNYGYSNAENLAQDIKGLNIGATPQDIADSAKSLKVGKITKAQPVYAEPDELSEGKTFWFLEEVMLENFMKKNMDKIMENVYKRLLPKLNN